MDEARPEAGAAASLVWLLRVVLPVLLFAFWYRSQLQPEPAGHSYPRRQLLAVRGDVGSAPEPLKGLRLVDEQAAQKLLGVRQRRRERPREPDDGGREQHTGGSRGGAADGEEDCRDPQGRRPPRGQRVEEPKGLPGGLTAEEHQRHLQLLSFLALQDRRQRSFLPEGAPPPPPLRPEPADPQQQNSEAQSLLQALCNPKVGARSGLVPKLLFQQLLDAQASVAEATFALLVEGCVGAGDLRGASDFLMRMEAAGHCADSELLDKVMDLYAAEGREERQQREPPWADRTDDGDE